MIPKTIKLALAGAAMTFSVQTFAGSAETDPFALNTRLGAKAPAEVQTFLSRFFTEKESEAFGDFSTFPVGWLLFLR